MKIIPWVLCVMLYLPLYGATHKSIQRGPWHDRETWENEVPVLNNNDNVHIGDSLGSAYGVTHHGTMEANNDLNIFIYTGDSLIIHGNLLVKQRFVINIAEGGFFKVNGNVTITAPNANQAAHLIVNGEGHITGNLTGHGTVEGTGNLYVDGDIDTTIIDLGPLPVELLSFTGNASDGVVLLKWVTASEINNMGFEVQRMVSDDHWENIGWVDGNYNHNGVIEYFFTDYTPDIGINYYRIRQIDYDGVYKFYGPLSVFFDPNTLPDFKVLKDESIWHICLPGDETYTIEVMGLSGRKTFTTRGAGQVSIPNPRQIVVIRIYNNSCPAVSRLIM